MLSTKALAEALLAVRETETPFREQLKHKDVLFCKAAGLLFPKLNEEARRKKGHCLYSKYRQNLAEMGRLLKV